MEPNEMLPHYSSRVDMSKALKGSIFSCLNRSLVMFD